MTKKPETLEELQADAQAHPERGKLNGDDVVRFNLKKFEGMIPSSLYREILEIGGVFGLDKEAILVSALMEWVSQPGRQMARQNFYQRETTKHGASELEVRSKVFGSYKGFIRKEKLESKKVS